MTVSSSPIPSANCLSRQRRVLAWVLLTLPANVRAASATTHGPLDAIDDAVEQPGSAFEVAHGIFEGPPPSTRRQNSTAVRILTQTR